MAEQIKEKPAPEKPAAKEIPTPELSKADNDLRNHFAGIALAEIVRDHVANRKAGQEDVAASWSFRYADRMLAQSKIVPRGIQMNVRGVPGVTVEPMVEVQ